MKIRDIIFWLHLSVGMTLGVFILLMSVTGVLLTYERQIIRMAQNSAISAPADAEPLSYQALADAAIEAGGVTAVPCVVEAAGIMATMPRPDKTWVGDCLPGGNCRDGKMDSAYMAAHCFPDQE